MTTNTIVKLDVITALQCVVVYYVNIRCVCANVVDEVDDVDSVYVDNDNLIWQNNSICQKTNMTCILMRLSKVCQKVKIKWKNLTKSYYNQLKKFFLFSMRISKNAMLNWNDERFKDMETFYNIWPKFVNVSCRI